MRKAINILKLLLIITILALAFIVPIVYANNIESIVGEANPTPLDENKTVESNILGAMQWIGYAIAVGMLIYIGIKYVTSAADERASLKGSLVKYVIGAVLIAGAVTLTSIIFNMGNSSTKSGKTNIQKGQKSSVNSTIWNDAVE